MRKAKVAILEEDSAQRDSITALLVSMPGIQILPPYGDRRSAAANILFVNVILARRNDFPLLNRPAGQPAIIALADSPEAALEAFNLRAIDCLLKPVQEAALLRAVQRAFDYLELREPKAAKSEQRDGRKYLRQIRVKKGDAVLFMPTEQILWLEAQDNYVRIHTKEQIFMERGRISAYEATLDPEQFLRVNRSAIVNVRQIQELRSMFKGAYSVILRNGARVAMARSIDKLEKLLNGPASNRAGENEAVSAEFAQD